MVEESWGRRDGRKEAKEERKKELPFARTHTHDWKGLYIYLCLFFTGETIQTCLAVSNVTYLQIQTHKKKRRSPIFPLLAQSPFRPFTTCPRQR